MAKQKVIAVVEREEWQERLRSSVLKFGFNMILSKSMLEFICAVADDVQWDRALCLAAIRAAASKEKKNGDAA